MADELAAEQMTPSSPEMIRVHANGSVSYTHVPRIGRERRPHTYYSFTGVVRYEDSKADHGDLRYVMAQQMSLRKAIKKFDSAAREAMIDEIDGILKRGVWTGVLKSNLTEKQRRMILRSSAFLKAKYDLVGNFLKLKARLVADGRGEDRSLFAESDIASPTVSISSLFTIASVTAAKGYRVITMDIGQAYLNADMQQDVYIKLEPLISDILIERDSSFSKYLDQKGEILVKLNKALYGCVESAKLWYNTISGKFISMGYVVNPYDPCVFRKCTEAGECIVCLYVDDIFSASSSDSLLEELVSELTAEYKQLTVNRGRRHEYLGMVFQFSESGTVEVTMKQYTQAILEECGISTSSNEPAANNLFILDSTSPLLVPKDSETFHRNVAQLLYMATRTRPDILLPIIFLSTRVRNPTEEDRRKLQKVMRYSTSM